jgi:glycosyltransferase involved in cell wall biosynthesis
MRLNMQTEQSLVSVLMTAYNREKFVKEAIESVLISTYTNFELIIVDDCSIDNTVAIAQSYAVKDNRIKVYVNETNLGDYRNRNKAASYSSGTYLMYVDSDDTIFTNVIADCVNIMDLHPESCYGMSGGKMNLIEPIVFASKDALFHHFFVKPFLMIGPGGTIQRRSFFEKIGGYPVKYGPANDLFYHLKATCFSSVVLLPFEFVYYRIHEGQEINNKYSYLYNSYNYLRDAIIELPIPLNAEQKKWILKKNKRRFFFNIIRFVTETLDLKKTFNAIRAAEFSFRNALEAIFQR